MPTIVFPEDRPEIVKVALYFLDTQCLQPRQGIILELCRFADKIGIKGLINRCDPDLAKEVRLGDPVEYLNFAELHALRETYRCSSIALLSQCSSEVYVPTSLSAKTAQKVSSADARHMMAICTFTSL